MKKYRHGFTLAEVLITLVIIGIIAAMTIPTLMNKTNEQELVVATKKAYSVLNQAYQRMIADYGQINSSSFSNTKEFAKAFVKYLNVQKDCRASGERDCFALEKYSRLHSGIPWEKHSDDLNRDTQYSVVLSDGMSVGISLFGSNTGASQEVGTYAEFVVDVNGHKGPNVIGIDAMFFDMSIDHFVPMGFYTTGGGIDDFYGTFNISCRENGWSCSAWVLAKGNMDYLRKDVSW